MGHKTLSLQMESLPYDAPSHPDLGFSFLYTTAIEVYFKEWQGNYLFHI